MLGVEGGIAMRDMILVERVTDGDTCGLDCPMLQENRHGDMVCCGPGEEDELEFSPELDGYVRHADCLATKSRRYRRAVKMFHVVVVARWSAKTRRTHP